MASLKKRISEFCDELREGIAYIAFYKKGRSWEAEAFWQNSKDEFEPDDIQALENIFSIDRNAIIVNGYRDCPFTSYDEETGRGSSIDFMLSHIKWRYDARICSIEELLDRLYATSRLSE